MITNFVADGVFFAELNELEVLRALKLGLPERSWACYGVLRFIMESVANGCKGSSCLVYEVQDGYMISSGQPVIEYIDSALRHVLLRQDVLGIKVKIIFDWHPKGKQYPKTPLPDLVTIHQPKEEGYMRPSVLATEIPLEIEVPVLAA